MKKKLRFKGNEQTIRVQSSAQLGNALVIYNPRFPSEPTFWDSTS